MRPWRGYQKSQIPPGRVPIYCPWLKKLIKWHDNFVDTVETPLQVQNNLHNIISKENRAVLRIGPQKFGKTTAIQKLIGDENYALRTYRPELHPRFFMNNYDSRIHKYILFEKFNFSNFDQSFLLQLFETLHANRIPYIQE